MIQTMQLSTNEAIVLQQIHEDGMDDIPALGVLLGLPSHYILGIVTNLRRKGLVTSSTISGERWVRLTRAGRRLVRDIWPDFAGFQLA